MLTIASWTWIGLGLVAFVGEYTRYGPVDDLVATIEEGAGK